MKYEQIQFFKVLDGGAGEVEIISFWGGIYPALICLKRLIDKATPLALIMLFILVIAFLAHLILNDVVNAGTAAFAIIMSVFMLWAVQTELLTVLKPTKIMSRTNPSVHILGIPGSLREKSFNKGLLHAAQEEAPDDVKIEIFELDEIPFFNQDVEAEGDPEPVQKLKEAIDQADAVLIATPEYQHGMSGVLKNALDWASRMPGESPLNSKIVGMMGATPSPVGTARAQVHLHEILIYNQCRIVAAPEVLVAKAPDKFENGRFTDDAGRKFIRQHLEALSDEVKKAEL